jgi:hypothetical protein
MRNWSKEATNIFKGKVIKEIKYMSEKEATDWDWQRAPIIVFTDGHEIMASRDDEGNGCGAFFTTEMNMSVIPQGGR